MCGGLHRHAHCHVWQRRALVSLKPLLRLVVLGLHARPACSCAPSCVVAYFALRSMLHRCCPLLRPHASGIEDIRPLTVDGVVYQLHLYPLRNWTASQQRCRQDGQQLLRLYSRQQGINVHAAVSKVTDKPYWLGLSDEAQEGAWVWSADSATLSTMEMNWAQGEPNGPNGNGPENCALVTFWRNQEEKWNDGQCSDVGVAAVCAPATITSACARYPCKAPATCTPSSEGSASSPADRTCSCPAGQVYEDDWGCMTKGASCRGPVCMCVRHGSRPNHCLLLLCPSQSWRHSWPSRQRSTRAARP